MEPVIEMPNNPIAELKPVALKERVVKYIERNNFAILNVVPDLPANGAVWRHHAH
jgi:hypothetical protein